MSNIVDFGQFYDRINDATDKVRKAAEERTEQAIAMGRKAEGWNQQLDASLGQTRSAEQESLEAAYSLDSDFDARCSEYQDAIDRNTAELENLRRYAQAAIDEVKGL